MSDDSESDHEEEEGSCYDDADEQERPTMIQRSNHWDDDLREVPTSSANKRGRCGDLEEDHCLQINGKRLAEFREDIIGLLEKWHREDAILKAARLTEIARDLPTHSQPARSNSNHQITDTRTFLGEEEPSSSSRPNIREPTTVPLRKSGLNPDAMTANPELVDAESRYVVVTEGEGKIKNVNTQFPVVHLLVEGGGPTQLGMTPKVGATAFVVHGQRLDAAAEAISKIEKRMWVFDPGGRTGNYEESEEKHVNSHPIADKLSSFKICGVQSTTIKGVANVEDAIVSQRHGLGLVDRTVYAVLLDIKTAIEVESEGSMKGTLGYVDEVQVSNPTMSNVAQPGYVVVEALDNVTPRMHMNMGC